MKLKYYKLCVGIGITDEIDNYSSFIGWESNSLGYHSKNKKIKLKKTI